MRVGSSHLGIQDQGDKIYPSDNDVELKEHWRNLVHFVTGTGAELCDLYPSIQPTGQGGPKRALRVVLVRRHWSPSVRRLGLSTGPRSYKVVKWLHMQRSPGRLILTFRLVHGHPSLAPAAHHSQSWACIEIFFCGPRGLPEYVRS